MNHEQWENANTDGRRGDYSEIAAFFVKKGTGKGLKFYTGSLY
jgi:hypothetical protein